MLDSIVSKLQCWNSSPIWEATCELQFEQKGTHEVLTDPIQSTLRAGQCFYALARPCFVEAVHKGQLKGEAKAIRVPFFWQK